jgi:hypothetical protein
VLAVENHESRRVTLRLTGFQPGASEEKLIRALQRMYRGKTEEQLRRALMRVPLVLSRRADEEQSQKIKRFLESQGAVVEISTSSAAGTRGMRAALPGTPAGSEPAAGQIYHGEERRSRLRVTQGIALHPMTIAQILNRSFRLLRDHFWVFYVIILIPRIIYYFVSKILQLAFSGADTMSSHGSMGIDFGVAAVFSAILFLVMQFWAQGALVDAVSETHLGHSASVGGSYGAMRRRLGRIIGTMLLAILLAAVPFIAGAVLAMISPVLTTVFFVAGLVLSLHLFLNWLMVDKVVVLEDTAWMSALRRSRELMTTRIETGFWKSSRTKASLILLPGVLIGVSLQLLLGAPSGVLGYLGKGEMVVAPVLNILIIAATSFVTAFTAVAIILYYYDIRVRKERFDLKIMAANL